MGAKNNQAANLMPTDPYSLGILQERAAILAKKTKKANEKSTINYIRFCLGKNEYYGIPFSAAKEVIEHVSVTTVPFAESCIVGMINHRGILLPILDLRKFFNINTESDNTNIYVIVVESNGVAIGIIADYIVANDAYPANLSQETVTYEGVINSKYVLGMHQGRTAILNIDNILLDLQQVLKQA